MRCLPFGAGVFLMAEIRPIDVIAAKWATVTPQRGADYEFGINNPRADWAQKTAAAGDAWKAGVTAAIQGDAFRKGVTKAGTAAWLEGAVSKGVQRWGPGVALAQDKYARGFAPFREAIARVQLPPRGPRRDPRNIERVRLINEALARVKTSGSS